MPPGETVVTCGACGYRARIPFSAVRRANIYCSQCGKAISLEGARESMATVGAPPPRPKNRRSSYRGGRRH
ncbi:MAG: hypothetical protein IT208_05165 [Chthonomonadales bacterium]|nr:hypothetical protein [Chthonomonadales bacterium]